MTQKQLYILISVIVIIGIVAAVFILVLNGKPNEQKPEESTVQVPRPPQIISTSTPLIIESPPLSDKPLPEEKPEEIKKQIEEEKKEEQKITEEKKTRSPLLPSYPIFNTEGTITQIKENGFTIKTRYGNYNVVFTENTSVFENQNDLVPTKDKAGLYLLKKDQVVAISTLNSLNDNETVTAATIRIK